MIRSLSLRTFVISTSILILGAAVPLFAAPQQIFGCTTISTSGSYVLANNIAAAGNCIVVAADYVTIDFDGFAMTGNGTGSAIKGDGIFRRGLTVRGGTIRNFVTGVAFSFDGAHMKVEDMFVSSCSNGGIGINGFAVVRNNTLTGNGDGINVGSRSLITGNNSSMNSGSGIVTSAGSTVTGNTVAQNGNNGLVAGAGCVVSNNTAQINGNYGIAVSCPTTLIANAAFGNTTGDILAPGAGCNRSQNTPAP
jgi:hypothetical protein